MDDDAIKLIVLHLVSYYFDLAKTVLILSVLIVLYSIALLFVDRTQLTAQGFNQFFSPNGGRNIGDALELILNARDGRAHIFM